MRRDLVEDVGNVERGGPATAQLSGGAQRVVFVGVGGVERLAARDRDQLAPAAEVPVDGRATEAGGGGDGVEAGVGILLEQPHGGLHDAGVVLLGVRAPAAHGRAAR